MSYTVNTNSTPRSQASAAAQSSDNLSDNGVKAYFISKTPKEPLLHDSFISREGADEWGGASSSELSESERSPIKSAIFNMLAGCGIVGLPQTFSDSGIFPGIFLMILVALLSIYTLRLLIKYAKKTGLKDYETLSGKSFGYIGYFLLSFSIFIFDVGQCIVYGIILGNSSHDVLNYMFGWDSTFDKRLTILCGFIIMLPFCLGKDFRFIEKVSAGAILSIIFMTTVVTIRYFDTYKNVEPKPNIEWGIGTLGNFLNSLGTIAFAFSQQDQTFLVYKTLKNPTIGRYTLLATLAMIIQLIICVNVGTWGYLSFGDGIQDDVLQNYPLSDHLILATRCVYTVTMILIFPTAYYPVRHFLYSMVYYKSNKTFERATRCQHYFFTLISWGFFTVVCIFVDDLGTVMSVAGLVGVVFLAFIMPCAIAIKLSDYPLKFWNANSGEKCTAILDHGFNVFLVLFGVFAAVVGTVYTFIPS